MFPLNKIKFLSLIFTLAIFTSFFLVNFGLAGVAGRLEGPGQTSSSSACPAGPQWLEDVYGIANGLLIPCECLSGGQVEGEGERARLTCGVKEIMQTIINFSKLILSLVGSLALLMFFYGGLTWILAGGSAEKIEKGKKIFVGAVIGIVIIIGAWVIVNFVIYALTGGEIGGTAQIFGKPWSQP